MDRTDGNVNSLDFEEFSHFNDEPMTSGSQDAITTIESNEQAHRADMKIGNSSRSEPSDQVSSHGAREELLRIATLERQKMHFLCRS